MGDLPLLQPSLPSNKRDRDQVDSSAEESETVESRSGASEKPRRIAGSRRVASKHALRSNQNMQIPIQDTSTPFTVTTSTEEFRNLTYSQSDTSTTMPPLNPELFPATDVVDHLSYGPVIRSWPTGMNVGPNMNPLFYDQMATIFSTPFGEMTEEELAMAIINASARQKTLPNDEANMYKTPDDLK
jgi:hypothetical protein